MSRTLLVIGAMKSGTSSLHRYLDLHPEVSMSRIKEPNFFVESGNWHKGLAWYESLFDPSAPVRGETSTNYSKRHKFPDIAARVHDHLPDATIVYVMRDPLERIVSHYMTNVSHAWETRSFDDALADLEDNLYLETSRYHWQLEPWIERFGRERILLFTAKQLAGETRRVMRRIFERVGVDPSFDSPEFDRRHHESNRKTKPTALGRRLRNLPGGRHLHGALRPVIDRPLERPRLSDALRARLRRALEPDVDALRELWGRELEHWSV